MLQRVLVGALAISVCLAASGYARQDKKNAQVENGQFTGRDNLIHPFSVALLAPAAFSGLSDGVRAALIQKGCMIPQPSNATGPENVISGHFRDASATDWAVLCSQNGSSSVMVFWGGAADKVDVIATQKDTDYVQAPKQGAVYQYWRRISTATPERIRKPKQNRKLEPFEHDGIDDAFVENGSVIHYWRSGQWNELQGGEVKK